MLTVVGFLEACAPRMVELVEAGATGEAYSEEVLMECLQVNDSLQKMLADIDTLAETETKAATTAASAAPKPSSSIEEQLDDLLLDDTPQETAPVGEKTTGEDDPFGNDVLAPAEDAKQPAVETKPAAASADPFGNDLLAATPAAPPPAAAPPVPPTTVDPFANETLTPSAAAPASSTDETTTDDFDSFLAERSTK